MGSEGLYFEKFGVSEDRSLVTDLEYNNSYFSIRHVWNIWELILVFLALLLIYGQTKASKKLAAKDQVPKTRKKFDRRSATVKAKSGKDQLFRIRLLALSNQRRLTCLHQVSQTFPLVLPRPTPTSNSTFPMALLRLFNSL